MLLVMSIPPLILLLHVFDVVVVAADVAAHVVVDAFAFPVVAFAATCCR